MSINERRDYRWSITYPDGTIEILNADFLFARFLYLRKSYEKEFTIRFIGKSLTETEAREETRKHNELQGR